MMNLLLSLVKQKKTPLSLVFCLLFFSITTAQNLDSNASNFWNNVQFGGGIGLNFGNGFFSGTLAPNAVYRFNDYVATGIGLSFSYAKEKNVFQSTVIGASIIGLFNPITDIQFSTEFEELYVNRDIDDGFVSSGKDKYWYPALFFGAGYNIGNVTFGIRYDVLYDKNTSIYSEAWLPFMRFYF